MSAGPHHFWCARHGVIARVVARHPSVLRIKTPSAARPSGRGTLSRLVAAWLVALIVAPFTAPFPTCDLTSLLRGGAAEHVPVAPRSTAALSSDTAVPVVPLVVAGAGRGRVLSLFRVGGTIGEIAPLGTSLKKSAALQGRARNRSILTTVLRL